MAKQRGPHQLSGKINNLCYYTQKGVRGGLVRRINDGMSERLKVGEEFSNTRRANSVFGMCSMFAGQIFGLFNARQMFLFRADRQSIFTKRLFEYYKVKYGFDSNSSFGKSYSFLLYLCRTFDEVVKNKFGNSFQPVASVYRSESNDFEFVLVLRKEELADFCYRNNLLGVRISIDGAYSMYPPNRDSSEGSFELGDIYFPTVRPRSIVWRLGDDDLEITSEMSLLDDGINLAFLTLQPVIKFIGDRTKVSVGKSICKMLAISVE